MLSVTNDADAFRPARYFFTMEVYMAEKVNKSEAIRKAIRENGELKNSAIVRLLASKNPHRQEDALRAEALRRGHEGGRRGLNEVEGINFARPPSRHK
jgi:ribonuclease I